MTITGTPPQDGDQRARSTTVATWLNTSFQMQFRVIDGLTVRFAQSSVSRSRGGESPPPPLAPGPETLLPFEPIWSQLAEHAHLVAIDLPGFGHSQRRD